jgi:uncharacterized membrane protein YkvA (DUF1232 family)
MRILRLFLAAKTALFRTVPLMRDAGVPVALKAGTIALALLIVSPIDVFGDIPGLGLLDDAALLSLLCYWFVRLASQHAQGGDSVARSMALAKRPGASES